MAKLSITSDDLQTTVNQKQALDSIIVELNSLDEDSELLNYLPIAAYGEKILVSDISVVTGLQTVSIKHGLNYKPFFITYIDFNGNGTSFVQLPFYSADVSPTKMRFFFYTYSDSTNLYFNLQTQDNGLGGNYAFFYYVFSLPMPT